MQVEPTPRPRTPHPSAEDATMAPLPIAEPPSPSSGRSRSRHGDNSPAASTAGVSPSLSGSRPPSPSAESTRSRTPPPSRRKPQPSPVDNKRERPASSTSRGGIRQRRTDGHDVIRPKPEEFNIGTDDEDGPGHDPTAASSCGPQLPFADSEHDSEEESEPETVDYRDDDEEDESDRGSGGVPSRTRISEWLIEFQTFVETLNEELECSKLPDPQGSAPRDAGYPGQQGSAPRYTGQQSDDDLVADLKHDVLAYFSLHCKDDGILVEIDDEVAAPSVQCPYAYFGSTPAGPATCPRTGVVITAPSARDSADVDPCEFVELEMSPQVSQLYVISEEFGSQLKEGEF